MQKKFISLGAGITVLFLLTFLSQTFANDSIMTSNVFFLSLASVANRSFTDDKNLRGWIADPSLCSINEIPSGAHQYGEIPFCVQNSKLAGAKDFLCLAGKNRKNFTGISSEITLPVEDKRRFKQLSLLHAGAWLKPEHTTGKIEVRYADGKRQILEVVSGHDLFDWFNGLDYPNCRDGYIQSLGARDVGLFVSRFPLAGKELESLHFKLNGPDEVWMIAAITLSESALELPVSQRSAVLRPGIPPVRISPKADGESYNLILLGDTHFDTNPEIYHKDYKEPNMRLNQIQRAEFSRNAKMWKERGPRLLTGAAKQVNKDTAMVIQLGDLVQGDCGNSKVHEKMLLDTLQYFKSMFPANLPLLTVAGNHDIRGPGAKEAYLNVIPGFLSGELKTRVESTNYSFMRGEDLFLFVDFNSPDVTFISTELEKHAGARYKFIVTHGAVLPSDIQSVSWILFGNASRRRRMIRNVFLRHDVIVLCGHAHTLELTECATDAGQITQLLVNSVWEEDTPMPPCKRFQTPSEYGKQQANLYKNLIGINLMEEYRPALTRYLRADGAGYVRMNVSPAGITAEFFAGNESIPTEVLRIR